MKTIRLLLGLLIFSTSLTLLYLAMRSVLDIGGFCAEGGPYVIENHCPEGVAFFAPLSIFGMFIGGGLYALSGVKNSPSWGYLFWTALFTSLGWNFLDFSINSPGGINIAWMICAVVFAIMGLGPLLIILSKKKDVKRILVGETFPDSAGILLLHIFTVAGAIWLGMYLFGLA